MAIKALKFLESNKRVSKVQVYGDNKFLRAMVIDKILNSSKVDKEWGYKTIDLVKNKKADLQSQLVQVPVIGDRSVVRIKAKTLDAYQKKVINYFIENTSDLDIIVELPKALKSIKTTVEIDCREPYEYEIEKWATNKLAAFSNNPHKVWRVILDHSGSKIEWVYSEIWKLEYLSQLPGMRNISQTLLNIGPGSVFRIIDCLVRGKIKEGMNEIVRTYQIEDVTHLLILALAKRFREIRMAKVLGNTPKLRSVIALPPFIVSDIVKDSAAFSLTSIDQIIEQIYQCERRTKLSKADNLNVILNLAVFIAERNSSFR